MQLYKFKEFIESWEYCRDKSMELHEAGVDIYDKVLDPYWGIVNPLMEVVFTEEQNEIINNYIYNSDDNPLVYSSPKNKSIEQLYNDIFYVPQF